MQIQPERNPKLTLMVGAPASGKTTRARELAEATPGLVRVSREDLRMMLTGDVYRREREALPASVQAAVLVLLLTNGHDVVVDNCHVTPRARQSVYDVAKALPFKVEITHEVMRTSEAECVSRNAQRPDGHRVPESLVREMAMAVKVGSAMGHMWLQDMVL